MFHLDPAHQTKHNNLLIAEAGQDSALFSFTKLSRVLLGGVHLKTFNIRRGGGFFLSTGQNF